MGHAADCRPLLLQFGAFLLVTFTATAQVVTITYPKASVSFDEGNRVDLTVRANLDTNKGAALIYIVVGVTGEAATPSLEFASASLNHLTSKEELDREKHGKTLIVTIKVTYSLDSTVFAEQTFLINVGDINDHSPMFGDFDSGNSYNATIREDATTGTILRNISVTDGDADSPNNAITLTVAYPNDALFGFGNFELVFFGNPGDLDRETKDMYTLEVTATDGGTPPLSSQSTVFVKITDANDNAPVITNDRAKFYVPRNAKAGYLIATVTTTDKDIGINAEVDFSLVNGGGSELGIYSNNGSIYVASSVATNGSFSVTVTVTDNGTPPKSTDGVFDILVEDPKDYTPKFSNLPAVRSIVENDVVPITLFTVNATDGDPSTLPEGQVQFSVTTANAHITVNSSTGVVTLVKPFDREYKATWDFVIRVSDKAPRLVKSSEATLTVNVLDANDNRPKFTKTVYEKGVNESAPINTSVLTVIAIDLDDGTNAELKYFIDPITDDGFFSLDQATGVLSIKKNLHQKTQATHMLTVVVEDGGSPKLNDTAQVKINAIEVNDNSPVFNDISPDVDVDENLIPGTTFYTINARDADDGIAGEFDITIISGNTSMFGISNKSFTLLTTFDYENLTVFDYPIRVRATDKGERVTEHNFTIYARDVNEFSPVFDKASYSATAVSTQLPGTLVVTIHVTDEDGNVADSTVDYSITAGEINNVKEFAVDSQGRVTIRGLIARANDVTFNLTINATDRGYPTRRSVGVPVTIKVVIDNNYYIPYFQPVTYSVRLNESAPVGTLATTVTAKDDDIGTNGDIAEYRLSQRGTVFAVDKLTGQVFTNNSLDFESALKSYFLSVSAIDGGHPTPHESTTDAKITVEIDNVNDNNPIFIQDVYVAQISEGEVSGTDVIQVSAADADYDVSNNPDAEIVRYSLSTAGSDSFSIDPVTGQVKTSGTLDRETTSFYQITVIATDQDKIVSNRLSGTATINITVTDVNDESPTFDSPDLSVTVPENEPMNYTVTTVHAIDADLGHNKDVRYSIGTTSAAIDFEVDAINGTIKTLKEFDRETQDKYIVPVVATDRGSPPLSSTVVVTVNIEDKNDNDPTFLKSIYDASIPENVSVGSEVLKVSATDKDIGVNKEIAYSIKNASSVDTFSIDNTTGSITTTMSLNFESKKNYSFTVVATDGGNRTGKAVVSIKVSDINDVHPQFLRSTYNSTIAENAADGTRIIQVSAVDQDRVGTNVGYRVASGGENKFEIDPSTGWITKAASLDFDKENGDRLFSLTIEAYNAFEGNNALARSNATVDITINPVNDITPKFQSGIFQAVTVEENKPAGSIYSVTAEDGDLPEQTITYRLASDTDTFSINNSTGVISTEEELDYESVRSYQLVIHADDHVGESDNRFTTMVLTVTVKDQNDQVPYFDPSSYSESVREDLAVGKSTFKVTAKDGDDDGTFLDFKIINPGDGHFRIGLLNSFFIVNASLDRETTDSYAFNVSVSDAAGHYDYANVNITIIDANDNAPIFEHASYSIAVPEQQSPSAFVVSVFATDADLGSNKEIRYKITGGDPQGQFSVGSITGSITVAKSLDREATLQYNLVVTAQDQGDTPLSSNVIVTVNITDDNDERPVIVASSYFGYVREDARLGDPVYTTRNLVAPVLTVEAKDNDTGLNAQIEYFLEPAAAPFKIDTKTGQISTKGGLDREAQNTYNLVVRARDLGGLYSESVPVTITITDDDFVFNRTFQDGYDCGKICSIGKSTEGQTAGELPWQATLCSPLQGHFCSGVVVSCSCILTAAHCVVQDAAVPINNITVCVGQHCRSCSKTDARGHSRCFKPISITPHHNFIPFTLNDIAVIKLRNPILCSRNSAMPVSLPNKTQDRYDSDTGPLVSSFVTGWERVNSSGSPSDCLRETEVRLITSYRGCELNYLTYRINGSPINNGVCAGDNGGPLVFKGMDDEGHYVLAGIVSWMNGCGTARETGVYTSVFTHLDWVEQMCKNT